VPTYPGTGYYLPTTYATFFCFVFVLALALAHWHCQHWHPHVALFVLGSCSWVGIADCSGYVHYDAH
jgi:hypothetical protein